MTQPRIHVALPWLEDATRDAIERRSLPHVPALAWLAARGQMSASTSPDWRHWLLAASGAADPAAILARYPAGPCVARLVDASATGVGSWACAQPAHLSAAVDHLRMAAPEQLVLTAAEIGELASTINEHLAGRGYTLASYTAGTWLLRCEDTIDCKSCDPAAAAGCNIHDYMPSGPDGARMRSLMNELQMVLHEHAVNERRERRREPMVNAVWLWGFGAPVTRGAMEFKGPLLASDDPWMRGLWQLHGAETVEWTSSAETIERTSSWPLPTAAGDCIVAVAQPPAVDTADALAVIERQLLEPIRSELAAGNVGTVAVLTGAHVVVVDSTARFKFWRGAGDLARWLA